MTTINSTIIPKIYKCRKNLLEQLKIRGFNVDDYTSFGINEIHNLYVKKQLDMLIENDNEQKVYVKFHINKNLLPVHVDTTVIELFDIENVLNNNTDQLIFIVKTEPNDTLVKTIEQIYKNDNIFITIININRLQYNILEHKLVPKHRILDSIEKEKLLKEFNIQDENIQLPVISRYDPVAIAIGMRPSQICEITRPSKTSTETLYYRICV